jgi:hypothetical protein
MKKILALIVGLMLVIPAIGYGQGFGNNYSTFKQLGAKPSSPPSAYDRIYFKTDGKFYYVNSAGTETEIGAADLTAPGPIGGTTPSTGAFTTLTNSSYHNTAYATVASHATTSAIWAAAGNIINFTGNETITALPNASQAGSQRWLICAGTPTFTHAGALTVQGGATYTAAAGDIILVTATTTTAFKITVFKQSGLPTVLQTTITGNAGTASALAADPANCSAGNAPLGITAAGAAEGCWAVAPATGIALTALAPQAAYTILANATAGSASPTAVAPTANGIWGCNASSVCGYYTNIAMDDSAFQFYSATASKGTLKNLLTGSTSGKLLTVAWNHTDNKTLNFPDPTTGDSVAYGSAAIRFNTGGATARVVTLPDANVTIPANPIGGTLGATTNILVKSSGTGTATAAASGITEDGTDVNAGLLNFVTSGKVLGGIKTILMGTDATYTFSAVDAYGSMLIQNHSDLATTINLPNYDPNAPAGSTTKVRLGAAFCVITLSAYATIINPADDDKIRTSNGTLNALGATITGPATVGAYSCYVLTDAQATKGTASGATTDTTGYATTTTTITLASAGTGTIIVGDIITFDGDTTKYTVTAGDADVSGGGTVTFTPGLAVAIETSAHAITVVETGTGHWTQMGINGAWPVTP